MNWIKKNKVELMGYSASTMYITAFFLVSQGFISGEKLMFNIMNLIGAIIFMVYAIIKKLIPVLILEIFWGGVAVLALIKLTCT
jgi:hypothetical protein